MKRIPKIRPCLWSSCIGRLSAPSGRDWGAAYGLNLLRQVGRHQLDPQSRPARRPRPPRATRTRSGLIFTRSRFATCRPGPAEASGARNSNRTNFVVRRDNKGMGIYGAQRLQPVVIGGKWDVRENGSDKRNRCRELRPVSSDRTGLRRVWAGVGSVCARRPRRMADITRICGTVTSIEGGSSIERVCGTGRSTRRHPLMHRHSHRGLRRPKRARRRPDWP
jgi:hypothetical protein